VVVVEEIGSTDDSNWNSGGSNVCSLMVFRKELQGWRSIMVYVDKDKLHNELAVQVNSDKLFRLWIRYSRENRHRIPPYPGSKIRDANIDLMKEFLEKQS
jgi:hypothetical protein